MKVYNPKKGEIYKYASIKRDGHFTTLQIRANGVRAFTRNGVEITEKLKYLDWFKDIRLGYDRDFSGELWLPGGVATDVPHAMKVKNPKLRFDVFSADHLEEGCPLEEVEKDALNAGLDTIQFWDFTDKRKTEMVFKTYSDVEGFVYSEGNRCNQVKEKPMRTADLVILGVTEGEGKYKGQIGAISVGLMGQEFATCSGFTDEVRRQISENPEAYIGKVVEIQYQKMGTGGRLRHPVFVQFREDKTAAECRGEEFE